MKRLLILFLLLGSATPVNAFWGSTEEEKDICRNRARGERNEFSAKQTYKVCLKNLKKEREEADAKAVREEKEARKDRINKEKKPTEDKEEPDDKAKEEKPKPTPAVSEPKNDSKPNKENQDEKNYFKELEDEVEKEQS